MQEKQTHKERSYRITKSSRWLRDHKTKAFYSLMDNMLFAEGVAALLQATGVGKMKPNILLLGYQSEWRKSKNKQIDEYFAAIKQVFKSCH